MTSLQDVFSRNTDICLDGRVLQESTYPTGAGGFADVFTGHFENRKVAVKVLRPFGFRQEKLFRRLWREYLTWSRLSHPNILACLGYSYDFSPRSYTLPSLISPWMEHGSVISYLQKCPGADRKSLMVGVAKGLSYLHTHRPVIIHGDLRGGNILVSEHGIPCLTDFGLSRVLEEIHGMTTSSDLAGAVRWMSPELFSSEDGVNISVTVKSDVWAYGMTALEVLSGERPYFTVKNDLIVLGIIRDGRTPPRPQGAKVIEIDDHMWAICQCCWSREPSTRPAMDEVISMITAAPQHEIDLCKEKEATGHARKAGEEAVAQETTKPESEEKEKVAVAVAAVDAATSSIISPPSPMPHLLSALATARPIENLNNIQYPEGIYGPKRELNARASHGKFRYDREFLLQFMAICKEKPDSLPPLDVIGLEPWDQNTIRRTIERTHGSSRTHIGGTTSLPFNVDLPEVVERKLKGLLNEFTLEKFDSISDQIIGWANRSEKEKDGYTLIQVIRLVFEKAMDETASSEMYARLCRKMMEQISQNVQDDGIRNKDGKPIAGGQLFRKYFLDRCREDFEHCWSGTNAVEKGMGEDALHFGEHNAARKANPKGLGLVKFIGELFKLHMLTESIVHKCIRKLLGNIENSEEDIEGLCKLIKTVGQQLDTRKARGHMDVYFRRMKELVKSVNIARHTRDMLIEVLMLREREWVTHIIEAVPMTITPVHVKDTKDQVESQIEQDQRVRSMGQDAMSGNGSRSGRSRGGKMKATLTQSGQPEEQFQRKKLGLLPRTRSMPGNTEGDEENAASSEESKDERKPSLTEEQATAKMNEDIKEFWAVRNLEEADAYFTELPAQFKAHLVEKLVASALERKEADAKLVADLLSRATGNNACSLSSLVEGFTPHMEFLDDAAIDVPAAYKLMALLLKGSKLPRSKVEVLADKIAVDGDPAVLPRDKLLRQYEKLDAS